MIKKIVKCKKKIHFAFIIKTHPTILFIPFSLLFFSLSSQEVFITILFCVLSTTLIFNYLSAHELFPVTVPSRRDACGTVILCHNLNPKVSPTTFDISKCQP